MEMKLPENCNQCHNVCPSEALKCDRGRAYFEALKNGETPPAPPKRAQSDNPMVRLLAACGHVAERKSEKMREHGADESSMFQCLTDAERAQLHCILEKLEQAWNEEHARHHGSHHGHHDKSEGSV